MFRRLLNVIRGFLGLFVSGVERRNPEALLEVENENLRKQIGQFNQGLASHAALCERLMQQTKKLEGEEQEIRAKTAANLRAGNREVAGQYALRLQTISRELTENRGQMQEAEKTYKNLVAARETALKAAQAKIESLRHSIQDLKVQRAKAELSEMASGMVTSIGGSGDTLDRLQKMVDEEHQKVAGKARVAGDVLNFQGVQIKEAEQAALAEQALADFAAKEGMALAPNAAKAGTESPASSTEVPGKSMGPITGQQ